MKLRLRWDCGLIRRSSEDGSERGGHARKEISIAVKLLDDSIGAGLLGRDR